MKLPAAFSTWRQGECASCSPVPKPKVPQQTHYPADTIHPLSLLPSRQWHNKIPTNIDAVCISVKVARSRTLHRELGSLSHAGSLHQDQMHLSET